MTIKMYVFPTGNTLIGEYDKQTDKLDIPAWLVMVQSPNGGVGISFEPLIMFSKKQEIYNPAKQSITEIDEESIDVKIVEGYRNFNKQYKLACSGLVMPQQKNQLLLP